MNRPVRDPYAGWCERRTSSEKSGEAVYSITSIPFVSFKAREMKCHPLFLLLSMLMADEVLCYSAFLSSTTEVF